MTIKEAADAVVAPVIEGMKGQPILLAVLVLNALMIGAALWFLKALAGAQAARMDLILKSCLPGHAP